MDRTGISSKNSIDNFIGYEFNSVFNYYQQL